VCFYTEHKIFPGHGRRFVRRDGKLIAFIDQKSRSLYNQKIKAQRLTWTQAWRRRNKKGKVETAQKKRGKRQARIFKSIAGITMEDLKKRRDVNPDVRKAEREKGLREAKEKAKKEAVEKKKAKGTAAKVMKKAVAAAQQQGFTKIPKQRRLASKPTNTSRR